MLHASIDPIKGLADPLGERQPLPKSCERCLHSSVEETWSRRREFIITRKEEKLVRDGGPHRADLAGRSANNSGCIKKPGEEKYVLPRSAHRAPAHAKKLGSLWSE